MNTIPEVISIYEWRSLCVTAQLVTSVIATLTPPHPYANATLCIHLSRAINSHFIYGLKIETKDLEMRLIPIRLRLRILILILGFILLWILLPYDNSFILFVRWYLNSITTTLGLTLVNNY